MDYTPEIMETIKAMAYGASDEEIAENCGMELETVAQIRTEFAADIAAREYILKGAGYCG